MGFENAIVDASGHPAVDNAERVRHVAALAHHAKRALASPLDARAILGATATASLLEPAQD